MKTIVKKLLEFSQLSVVITILFYVVGFMISNLFLGSFGVISFTILRARYISTGILYGIFIAIIIIPLYELIQAFIENYDKSVPRLLTLLSLTTFSRYMSIFFIFYIFSIFTVTDPHYSISDQNTFVYDNFSDTVSASFEGVKTIFVFGVLLALFLIGVFCLIYLIINPKSADGVRTTRKEKLKHSSKEILNRKFIKSILNLLIAFAILSAVIGFIPRLIRYLGGSEFSLMPQNMDPVWLRFIGIAFLIYILIAIPLIVRSIPDRLSSTEGTPTTDSKDTQIEKFFQWLVRLTWIIVLTIPVFTFNIYGSIPQQFGGGKPISIQVLTVDSSTTLPTNKLDKTYLLDRTNESLILLLEGTEAVQVIEIPNSKLAAILYNPVTNSE